MIGYTDIPACLRCNREGERSTYKDTPVFECPNCENILLREVVR